MTISRLSTDTIVVSDFFFTVLRIYEEFIIYIYILPAETLLVWMEVVTTNELCFISTSYYFQIQNVSDTQFFVYLN